MLEGQNSGMFMKFTEGAFWVIGSLLTAFFLGSLGLSELQRQQDIAAFKAMQPVILAYTPPAELPPLVTAAEETVVNDNGIGDPDKSLWSSGRIAAFTESIGQKTSDVLGVLEIPRLELEVPLYDGASDLHMDRGIARIEGTAMPDESGNMGIAGHRDGYFRVLKDIEFGDELILSSSAGMKRYRVEQLMIVEPSAVEVLDPTEDTSITLVTCYPFYFVGHAPKRFIVRAVLQDDLLITGG